jgi:hypothetical protein
MGRNIPQASCIHLHKVAHRQSHREKCQISNLRGQKLARKGMRQLPIPRLSYSSIHRRIQRQDKMSTLCIRLSVVQQRPNPLRNVGVILLEKEKEIQGTAESTESDGTGQGREGIKIERTVPAAPVMRTRTGSVPMTRLNEFDLQF